MQTNLNLEEYLNSGIESLVKDILRTTLKNPRASVYFASYALAAKRAEKRRQAFVEEGEHIPLFLIASITETCNLNCAGCYDRANHPQTGCAGQTEMSRAEWSRIFTQAEEAGISAILLAGGEPLMRTDVISEAAAHPAILFPVFTNGTALSDRNYAIFDRSRNLIPIISIEGGEAQTDTRRGEGVYARTMRAMDRLAGGRLLFGASITVTSENIQDVTSAAFLEDLRSKGCRAAVFVEYVPVTDPHLALDDAGRDTLSKRVEALRETNEMIIISFPGDEKESGGCLAAGRGFFHINASGNAEPCPFSPYSDTNLKTVSLREALRSPLFTRLRADGFLTKEHTGGCALFEQAEQVQEIREILCKR